MTYRPNHPKHDRCSRCSARIDDHATVRIKNSTNKLYICPTAEGLSASETARLY